MHALRIQLSKKHLHLFFCSSSSLQIPSYKVGGRSTGGRYANIKSKIDQSDPNPAHKLKRTLSDLTSDAEQGREINPRFSTNTATATTKFTGSRVGPDLQRRSTVDYNSDRFPRSFGAQRTRVSPSTAGIRSSAAVLRKSGSLDSPLRQSGRVTAASSSSLSRDSAAAMATKSTKMSELAEEEEEVVVEEKQKSGGDNGRVSFEEAEEDEFLNGASVEGWELGRRVINPVAFAYVEEESDAPSRREDDETAVPQFLDEGGDAGDDGDLGICGVEVTNSSTETTVVLKHLLALSGKRSQNHASSSAGAASDMTIIEEDELEEEDEYYESKDTPLSPSSVNSFSLPHPIPRLIVTCEGEGLVETVVDVARDYSAMIPLYGVAENDGVLSTRL